MPPKKVHTAPPQQRTKAPPKRKLVPPPPKTVAKRQAPSPSPSSSDKPIPTWDQGIRSKYARERTRFKLTRASLLEDLDQDYIEQQAQKLMGESKNSWGSAESNPIEATRRKKRKTRGGFRRGSAEDAYMNMLDEMRPRSRVAIPNDAARSPILGVPLEVRERIYGYLLVYLAPIKVKPDWMTLERNPFVDHSILRVCKLFAAEGSNFLYRNNTFQSLIRNPATAILLRFDTPVFIPKVYHSAFRNLIIDCSKTCWNMEWYEKAVAGLNTLVEANAVIESLTLSMVPQRVGMSTTALGMEVSPVTFADFLWYPGPFMEAVRKLAPRKFKVVVKKAGKKKLGMQVDLTYLRVNTEEDNALSNEETLKLRNAHSKHMEEELLSLKDRFEEIFENDEWAVSEGKCSVISSGESRMERNDEMVNAVRRDGAHGSGEGSGSASRVSRERSESEEMHIY